jgi:hypothetical protein
MKGLLFSLVLLIAASVGVIAGSDPRGHDRAWGKAAEASGEMCRSTKLREEAARLQSRLVIVKREIDTAQTPAAATAARAALFQLRVDMVALEDELAVLASRRRVADDF